MSIYMHAATGCVHTYNMTEHIMLCIGQSVDLAMAEMLLTKISIYCIC